MDKPNNNNNETVESTSNQPPRADSTGDDGSSFFAGSLPADVVKRVNALRNLQVEHHKIEANFFEEVHALECRFLDKYQDLYNKRSTIIKGTYEPTEAEAKCEFDGDDEPKNDEPAEKTVGIPEFWLQVFKNSDIISDLIKEHDEDVLKHLIDVRITMQNEENYRGFTIEFEFTSNEFFTNSILTKQYELRTGPDEQDPLSYEGPEIVKSKGCEIQWNKGKNVTVKMVKKRQKHKNRGTIRVVTKEVQTDSFFNFFSPPTVPEGPDAELEESEEMSLLAADFEIGHMLRDSIVPKAVLYYTGEIGDEDDGEYDEDEDDEDDDEDDDDDDEDDEEEEEAATGGHRKHAHGKARGGKHGGAAGQQPECKQQ